MKLNLRDKITGLATNRRPNPGETKQVKNWLLGLGEGALRCETRPYSRRIGATHPDGPIESLGEIPNDDGTYFKLFKADAGLFTYTVQTGTPQFLLAKTALTYPAMVSGFDKLFICDEVDGNLVWDGVDFWPLVELTPPSTPTITESALAAVDFGTGIFEYQFTFFSSTKGWETVPHAPLSLQGRLGFQVNKVNDDVGVDLPDLSGDHFGIYDRTRWYRRLRNTNQWYLVAENQTAVTDVVLELDFTALMLSEVHDNDTGLIDMEIPEPSPTAEMHRGRLFLTDEDEVRWSVAGLPFIFKSSGVATHKFQENTDFVMSLVSYRESLVVFKRRSIWVMSGDADEANFVFYPHSAKLGAFGRRTYACTPKGVYFMASNREFYLFTLDAASTMAPLLTSVPIDFQGLDDTDSRLHSAGWDPLERIAVFVLKFQTGLRNLYIATDGDAIGEMSWLEVEPQVVAEMHDSDQEADGNERCLYFGSLKAFVYRMFDRDQLADGPSAGTLEGLITTNSINSIIDSGAAFDTKLLNIPATKIAADGTVETRVINLVQSTTQLLVAPNWTTSAQVGDQYFIGAADFRLWLGGVDADMSVLKRFMAVLFGFQPGAGIFDFGITDTEVGLEIEDEDSVEVSEDVGLFTTTIIFPNSREFRISPYVKGIGVGMHCSIDDIEIDYEPLRRTV